MWLNLKGMGTQPWNSLNMNTRRSIIKAQENGVTIEEKGIGDVAEYYKMLISTYGRLGIRQAPPLDLYRKALILLNGRIKLFFAKYKSINIAGGIFLFFKDTVTFWNGASYKQYWDVCPNHLLHWSIICSGRDNGFTFYNMLHYHNRQGKIIPGLERFKSGFGARPRFFYCAYKSSPYAMYNFARALTGKGEQT
jgi:lipid II:glycine glycyltransferase (peptidoglycan interpeptide bridge formation enzyme)